ncbi:hypothetical protein GF314_11565 [bacterium]|nr:hypothetical protein [bacterium]
MRRSLALAAACLMASVPAPADDMVEDVGEYFPTFFAEMQDVELDADKAYVFGVGGLAIIGLQDPTEPFMIGRYVPPGDPYVRFYRGAVDGDFAYGGAREDGLMVIDTTPATQPIRLAVHGEPGMSYEGCALAGDLLFACRHADGLEIIDVTGPQVPQTVSEVTGLVNSWDVVVRDDLAYVADGLGGLAIVDATDPAAPFVLATHPTAGVAVDVVLHGDIAVVAMGSAGLELVDVGDPAQPATVGTYDTTGLAITVDVDEDLAHVADWDDIEVINIADPAAPVLVGRENTPVRAMGLAAGDGLVHLADWSRYRIYRHGPSSKGDIEPPLVLEFGDVPAGAVADSTVTIANTGGAPLTVTEVLSFDARFEVLPPASFVVPPGGEHPLTIRYHNDEPGYDVTVLRIDSDDTDEPRHLLPVTGEPDPNDLNLGDPAPPFSLYDMDGVLHRLGQYRGRVVVLAFFANW